MRDEGEEGLVVLASALGGYRPAGDESKTGVTDCRVASLLAMTMLNRCHSEASAHTGRGNPRPLGGVPTIARAAL